MNLFKFYIFIGLVILSITAHGQSIFSKSFDIANHSDNGVKVLQVDTLLITHSISGCYYPAINFCTGIICTDLEGGLKWKINTDSLSASGNDAVIVENGIIYIGVRNKHVPSFPLSMMSYDLEGNHLATVPITVNLNIPSIRSITKTETGWILNITEELAQNHRFASLVWLDEEFNIIEKKTYSDLTYHFWVQELIDLGEEGFVASGTYRTPEWSQEHSVIKMDVAGNVEWSFRLPPPYASGLTSLAMTDDGNFIVTYPLYDFTIFPEYDRPYTIQKVTHEGDVLWRHIFYNLGPQTIAEFIIAENGDIVGVGQDVVDGNNYHGFLFRMNQEGTLLWQKAIGDFRFGYPANDLKNVLELDNGDLVMCGSIIDTVGNINPNQESLNTWLVRTDANGCIYEACEDITQIVPTRNLPEQLDFFELWPTVGVDKVEIVPRGEVVSGSRWTINIVNLAGQTLENIPVNRFPYTLSVTDYPAGIYFVRLEDEGGAFQMLKMIKI